MRVLGIDTGFASFGWAVVEVTPDGVRLIDLGVIRTKKSAKKAALLATEDNFDRGRLIARELSEVLRVTSPDAVSVESMSWPRSASVVAKMGIAWGVLIATCEEWRLPVVQSSPQRIKRALTGRGSATKDEVLAAVEAVPGLEGVAAMLTDHGIPRGQWEHPVDAVAAVVAALESDVVRAMMRVRR